MTDDILIRTADGRDHTWDSTRYGFAVRENGNLLIQLAGEATAVSVAIYAAGQWISVIDGSWL